MPTTPANHLLLSENEELRLRHYVWLLTVFWTLAIGVLLGWSLYESHREMQEIALAQARTHFNRDLAFRSWVAANGGIYVPQSENLLPNPYLKDIPERDITTPSGRQLTLMNPDYMVRQVNLAYPDLHGIPTHVSSLNPSRLTNAPDEWEQQALKAFNRGVTEVAEFTEFEGAPFLRLMRPLLAEEACQKCHKEQKIEPNAIQGGMQIILPLDTLTAITNKDAITIGVGHGILWLLGLFGIRSGHQRLQEGLAKRRQVEEIIKHQAYHDTLTNLPNRRLFLERLHQAFAQSKRHNHLGSVLFLDLDKFKAINDSLGHAVGDDLLQEVAERLKSTIREEDTASRLGGDEFVILLAEVSDDNEQAIQQTRIVAEKIQSALSAPYAIQGHEIQITPSTGISLFPRDTEKVDDVLKQADTAMYHAKAQGRNTICIYSPEMENTKIQR
jgi:diguanylate cyclase (GGDEF)-like protein